MNRKTLSLVMAGILSASAVFPAFASGTSGGAVPTANGTEVWAGVTLWDEDAKIKVEVPTLFAFVVNGSVGTGASTAAITVDNDALLLPNMKVRVDTPSTTTAGGEYSIQAVGDGVMQFTNYSTKADTSTSSGRIGLDVTINGNIKNEGTPFSRNYWEHTVSVDADVTADAGFKKYNINIDGNNFDTPANGGLEMAAAIDLDAPIDIANSLNLDTTTGLAKTGVTKTVDFGVTVGGVRSMYTQVEQSAKVGTIVWTVSAEVEVPAGSDNVVTAPDEPFLEEPGTP